MTTEFSKRLSTARAEKGITLAQLRERGVALTKQQLGQYEEGKHLPRPEAVYRLAKALDVSPCWLAWGSDCHKEPHSRMDPGQRQLHSRFRIGCEVNKISCSDVGKCFKKQLSRQQVNAWAHGNSTPTIETIGFLGELLQVKPCWLAWGEKWPQDND